MDLKRELETCEDFKMVELWGTSKTRQTIGVEILSPLGVSAVQLAILQCVATDQNCLTAHDWAAAVYACS